VFDDRGAGVSKAHGHVHRPDVIGGVIGNKMIIFLAFTQGLFRFLAFRNVLQNADGVPCFLNFCR